MPAATRVFFPYQQAMKRTLILILAAAVSALCFPRSGSGKAYRSHAADSVNVDSVAMADSIVIPDEIITLSDQDYEDVARELGVEIAAIKAVVDIEAGKMHQGFSAPGKPLINFDLSMFRQFARRNGVNLSPYTRSHSIVFARPDSRRYGSQQNAQHERLKAAMTIDRNSAIQGTFWGMFQIGGFNWKLCGCKSIDEFVKKMSRSERDQLELFAAFIKSIGLDAALRDKNWAKFARRYNGPSYASRGYHTRMANAYARHKKLEKSN